MIKCVSDECLFRDMMSDIAVLTESKDKVENCIIAIEELSELQKGITKALRYPGTDPEYLVEEIADVLISIRILQNVFSITDGQITDELLRKMQKNLARTVEEMKACREELQRIKE